MVVMAVGIADPDQRLAESNNVHDGALPAVADHNASLVEVLSQRWRETEVLAVARCVSAVADLADHVFMLTRCQLIDGLHQAVEVSRPHRGKDHRSVQPSGVDRSWDEWL